MVVIRKKGITMFGRPASAISRVFLPLILGLVLIVPVLLVVPAAGADGIAALYPGDVGIENHPDVIFVERFEEATLTELFIRWTDILNGPAMSFSPDVPAGSPGARSLNIPWVGGGVNDGGHL